MRERRRFARDQSRQISCDSNCDDVAGVDHVIFDTSCISVVSPADEADYDLTLAQHTATQITFDALSLAQDAIDWTVTVQYQTSGGRGPFTDTRSFSTDSGAQQDELFKAVGGQVTSEVTSSDCPEEQVTTTITGVDIPEAEVTRRLVNLYSTGATPRLMTGIAQVESRYRQFSPRLLYGRADLWPTESFDGGSHIGLMQVPVSMATAWSWVVNTETGVSLFQRKLAAAQRVEDRIIALNPGLRQLTPVELENMALVLYGPFASSDLAKQYYAPQCTTTCDWIVNTAGNPEGVAYADKVRASMH